MKKSKINYIITEIYIKSITKIRNSNIVEKLLKHIQIHYFLNISISDILLLLAVISKYSRI